jgi:hypothetical protein
MKRTSIIPALGFLLCIQACILGGGGTGGEGLSGIVVDQAGTPVSGATVGAYTSSGTSKTAVTDAAGRFRISGLNAGSYNLAASHRIGDSTYARFVRGIEVSSQSGSGDLEEIILLPTGKLTLKVQAYEGDPIVGARCAVEASPYITVSDSSGTCAFDEIAPGSYRIGIEPEAGDTAYSDSVEVESGIVSGGTTIIIMSGPDLGESWVARTSGTKADLRAVIWTGRQYVAVGDSGTVVFSENSKTWVVRNVGNVRARLRGITWTDSLFVAVGSGILDSGVIYTSPTGTVWTRRENTPWGLNAVTWTGTQLVAVGEEGEIWTSPDGVAWDSATSGTSARLSSVAWNGAILVAVGSGSFWGNAAKIILTSTDGLNWINRSDENTPSFSYVFWNGRRFYAGGNGFQTSLDGLVWESSLGGSFTFSGAWAGDRLVNTGYFTSNNAGGIWTSDGDEIMVNRYATQPYVYLNAIASRPYLQLVVVGDNGMILTSH